jgi:hypothetical protein
VVEPRWSTAGTFLKMEEDHLGTAACPVLASFLHCLTKLLDKGVTMKKRPIAAYMASGLVALACADTAHAQQHTGLLKQVLGESAKGNCPASLMSPMLLGACQSQMPGMGQALAARGAISKTEFMGMQQSQMGPAEVYKVTFGTGTMMWMINTGPDGKILVLWSPG